MLTEAEGRPSSTMRCRPSPSRWTRNGSPRRSASMRCASSRGETSPRGGGAGRRQPSPGARGPCSHRSGTSIVDPEVLERSASRRLRDRASARPRRDGGRLPARASPRSTATSRSSGSTSSARTRRSRSASSARRGWPPRSSTRTSSRCSTSSSTTACRTSRWSTSPAARCARCVGRSTLPQIFGVLEGMLAGLAHAEEHGMAHRDLKPENVLRHRGAAASRSPTSGSRGRTTR